jgi:hypothetical protein
MLSMTTAVRRSAAAAFLTFPRRDWAPAAGRSKRVEQAAELLLRRGYDNRRS